MSLINVFDQFIHILVPAVSILILEVCAHWEEHIICWVVFRVGIGVVDKPVHYFVYVIVFGLGVVNERIVISTNQVPVEGRRWTLLCKYIVTDIWSNVIITIEHAHSMSEDIGRAAKIVTSLPYKLHCSVSISNSFVLVVESGEKESIEAHLCEQVGLFSAVSERVELPSDLRNATLSETVLQYPVTPCHLIDDLVVVRSCLVVHRHTTIGELQTTLTQSTFQLD